MLFNFFIDNEELLDVIEEGELDRSLGLSIIGLC